MMEAAVFLEAHGWGTARQQPLQADFSTRRFFRLSRPDGEPRSAILMMAAAEQKTREFAAIAALLRQAEISAPEIYAVAPELGLTLMEDLGDANIGRALDQGREAWPFYRRAAEMLAHWHRAARLEPSAVEGLPVFNAALFTEQVGLFIADDAPAQEAKESFAAAWLSALTPLDALPQTLILRDFMPDNLIDLPERRDWRGVGVVDFQDGGTGPLPYDLASLCEAVRRDGGAAMLEPVLAHYHARHPVMPLAELKRTCRILAAQRHMRILGIVARLARDPARRDKRAYLPRIAAHLQGMLQDEALRPVRKWCEDWGVSLDRVRGT